MIPHPDLQNSPHGDYFGAGLTTEEYDLIAVNKVDRKHFKEETSLFQSKWFDYRMMHPVEATYLFAAHYSRAYARMASKRLGDERGQYSTGVRGGKDLFDSKPINYQGMWKARQTADRLGIPYDFYCSQAMEYASKNLWRHIPRPQQLAGEKIVTWVVEAWLERLRTCLQVPLSSFYRMEWFCGHPFQIAFQEWLCDHIQLKANPEYALATCLELDPVLTREVAERFFPKQTLEKALKFVR